jgi:hypothetical protein
MGGYTGSRSSVSGTWRTYEPQGAFVAIFERTKSADAMWQYIRSPDTVEQMKTAALLRRPPVEVLSAQLRKRFGDEFTAGGDAITRLVGNMVSHMMSIGGKWEVDRKGVRVKPNLDEVEAGEGSLFKVGTTYKKRDARRRPRTP